MLLRFAQCFAPLCLVLQTKASLKQGVLPVGISCRRGLSCVALSTELTSYGTPSNSPFADYRACVQTASGENRCKCYNGPIPVNGYCFIYGNDASPQNA